MDTKRCPGCMRFIDHEPCIYCGFQLNTYQGNPRQLRIGTTLANGRYLLGRALGEGGFGITYIAWDATLKLAVAIKEYYPEQYVTRDVRRHNTILPLSGQGEDIFRAGKRKFMDEAQRLAQFTQNPGIVTVRDFIEENDTAYIVMEYIAGKTLADYARQQPDGRIPPAELLPLLRMPLDALCVIHSHDMLHRDISPENAILSNLGYVKLIDFGAARDLDLGNLTERSRSVMLRPGYAPLEQYSRTGKQGPWTDVYALCATIYALLTGVTPPTVQDRLLGEALASPRALGVPISQPIEDALFAGLAVLPEQRTQSVDGLIAALYGSPQPKPKPQPEPKPKPQPQPEPQPFPQLDDDMRKKNDLRKLKEACIAESNRLRALIRERIEHRDNRALIRNSFTVAGMGLILFIMSLVPFTLDKEIKAYTMYMFGWPQVLVMVGAMLSAQKQRRVQWIGVINLVYAAICNAVYQTHLFENNVINSIVWQTAMMVVQFAAGIRFQRVMGSLRSVRLKTVNSVATALLLTGSIALSQLNIDNNLIHFTNGYSIADWYVVVWLALLALTAWLAYMWIHLGKMSAPQKPSERTKKRTMIVFSVASVLFILLVLLESTGAFGWAHPAFAFMIIPIMIFYLIGVLLLVSRKSVGMLMLLICVSCAYAPTMITWPFKVMETSISLRVEMTFLFLITAILTFMMWRLYAPVFHTPHEARQSVTEEGLCSALKRYEKHVQKINPFNTKHPAPHSPWEVPAIAAALREIGITTEPVDATPNADFAVPPTSGK